MDMKCDWLFSIKIIIICIMGRDIKIKQNVYL